jgi:hypothetical protein
VTERGRRVLVGLVVAVLLSACQLELDVNVEVAEDGSGTIEVVTALDDDAVARVGGDLGAILALDDLRASGWTVDGPERETDGRTRLRVQRSFDDPEDAAEAFAELSGEGGPFQGLMVTRQRSFLETRWGFRGRVDLGEDVAVRGAPLDAQVSELETQLGQSLSRLVQVRVRVRLPGDVSSNATTKAENGAVWQVAFGGDALDLEATGTERRTGALVLIGAGVLAALVLLVYLLVRLAVRQSDRAAP